MTICLLGFAKPAKASRYSMKLRRGIFLTSRRRTTSGTPIRKAERITSACESRVPVAANSMRALSSPSTGTGNKTARDRFIVKHYNGQEQQSAEKQKPELP
jgi:hypothetical protein